MNYKETAQQAMGAALQKYDGSALLLARAIGRNVLRQSVLYWQRTGNVPAEYCEKIAELTGVQVWELRPMDWREVFPTAARRKGAPPRAGSAPAAAQSSGPADSSQPGGA